MSSGDEDPRHQVGQHADAAGQRQGDGRDAQQHGVDVEVPAKATAHAADHPIASASQHPTGPLPALKQSGDESDSVMTRNLIVSHLTRPPRHDSSHRAEGPIGAGRITRTTKPISPAAGRSGSSPAKPAGSSPLDLSRDGILQRDG